MKEGTLVSILSPEETTPAIFLNGKYLSLETGRECPHAGCKVVWEFLLKDLSEDDWCDVYSFMKVGWTDQARAGALAARHGAKIKEPKLRSDLKGELFYNGVQENAKGEPIWYLFTDKKTKDTFSVEIVGADVSERVSKKLKEVRGKYQKKL